jgi:hypothetical protein
MSSDFERRLREARESLPGPEPPSTERARARALRAIRRRRPRARIAALVGVALAVAVAAGVGIGALIAPDVTATRGPVGVGFLPQPGWYVLQTSARERADDPVVTVAANVPFAPEDDLRGLADASGLPYGTLLRLPPDGIVIVATFLPRGDTYLDTAYEPERLPLRLARASPWVLYGTQVRPEEPLGQYQLRGAIDDYNVDLVFYFGRERPTSEQLRAAQRQLSSLVVRSPGVEAPTRASAPARGHATTFDRAFACVTRTRGGINEIEARSHSGVRETSSRWKTLPFAVAATGTTGSAATRLDNSLAWITAGKPTSTTQIEEAFIPLPVLSQGTVAVSLRQCRSTRSRIPLTSRGLRGGVAGQLGETYDCESPRRVLVRVRARLTGGSLRSSRGFLRASATVSEASLAVRTTDGRPLLYASVEASGRARLYTSARCVPD